MEFLRNIIEAVLFASKEAMTLEAMQAVFPSGQAPEEKALREILLEIKNDYASRGLELVEVSSGFRFQVRSAFSPWVSRLWDEKPARYSRALLETLSLIAYRQPITRGEIEAIRGVSVSSHIIKTLTDRNWIRVIGYRELPGRPALFATTKIFLDYFNLRSLGELPTLQEIREWRSIEDKWPQGSSFQLQEKAESSDLPFLSS